MSEQESLAELLSGSSAFNPAVTAKVTAEPVTTDVKTAIAEPAATSAAKETPTPEPAKAETKADEDTARDEKGRFQKTVPQEALHAERQKRQELERQLKERDAKPPTPPPSVLEDEDGAFNARISQATASLHEKLINLSVKAARNLPGREDYQEVTSAFLEAADQDPQLMNAFRAAADPGEYAYAVGKQIKELSEVGGDIKKYGEMKSAAVRAELDKANERIKALEAEVAGKAAAKQALDDAPRSLNANASAAPKSATETDDEPLSNLTRFNKRG